MIRDLSEPKYFLPLLIGVLGFGFGIFAYYDTKAVSEISYRVSTIKIFDSGVSSPKISVFDDQDRRIKEDIFISEFIVWNSGNTNIPSEKIRIPISFDLINTGRIVDYAIAEQNPEGISKFRLEPISLENLLKRLKLSWTHFDPNYALKIRVIFAGNSDSKIEIKGLVSGINKFKNATHLNIQKAIFYSFITFITSSIGIIFALALLQTLYEKLGKTETYVGKNLVNPPKSLFVVVLIIGLTLGLVVLMHNWVTTPPL